VGLYSNRSATSEEIARALLQWVECPPKSEQMKGCSSIPNLTKDLRSLLNYQQLVAYHPQANGLAERCIMEVIKHLRALMYERRIKERWSQYLQLVRRILNYSIDESIGMMPARVILGDLAESDLVK
jgi:hypothetical protein